MFLILIGIPHVIPHNDGKLIGLIIVAGVLVVVMRKILVSIWIALSLSNPIGLKS